MHSPSHIANFFLSKKKEGIIIDNYKLSKLVYVAYGYGLAILNIEIFEELIEAWKYGPVIPSLYHEFKYFGTKPISRLSEHYSESRDEKTYPEVKESKLLTLLDMIYKKYAHWDKKDFEEMTHHKNSPWFASYVEGKKYIKIDTDSIKEYFKKILPLELPSDTLQKQLKNVSADIKN